jgi:peptide/nickel transport system permease protein
VWTYIIRRLLVMIPTLFGVTIISFCIMQMAPGDPQLSQLSSTGTAGESSQTREAYLIQKRDLKLDKPLIFNFNYFRDYSSAILQAAHYQVLTVDELAEELRQVPAEPAKSSGTQRLGFLAGLGIDDFDRLLSPPQLSDDQLKASGLTREAWETEKQHKRVALAKAVKGHLQVWCEDTGLHAVSPAIALLKADSTDRQTRIGVLRSLSSMVVNPFTYTFSQQPSAANTKRVLATWKRLWPSVQNQYPPVDPDRATILDGHLKTMASATRKEMFDFLQGDALFSEDAPYFANVLLGEAIYEEKLPSAEFLRLYISRRIQTNVANDATEEEIEEVTANWLSHYDSARETYRPAGLGRYTAILLDTQYAHMVGRLVTFNFGRSALKTKEPVASKLFKAVMVSAPLMIMAQLVIYLLAVPLGVLCAINRGNLIDRLISLKLFFLFSIPPFVAGMLFLLFFCYGSYVKWFPMERLHSPGAESFGYFRYLTDYFWHAFLPVTCLSLFSLAGLAMYARTSMLDVLGQDYIRTARAKGVTRPKVILKHALRNGILPILTLFANFLPAMLGGSVLIEYLFNIPGMGRLSFTSIEQKDFPTLMALVYIQAIVVMLSILMTDILYVFVDPRISFEKNQ